MTRHAGRLPRLTVFSGAVVTADEHSSRPSRCSPSRATCRQVLRHGRGQWSPTSSPRPQAQRSPRPESPGGEGTVVMWEGSAWAPPGFVGKSPDSLAASHCPQPRHAEVPPPLDRGLVGPVDGARQQHPASQVPRHVHPGSRLTPLARDSMTWTANVAVRCDDRPTIGWTCPRLCATKASPSCRWRGSMPGWHPTAM
jgi:hypothetical protein